MNYYNRDKTASYKASFIGFGGIILIIIYLALTSCAYRQYHKQNFKGNYPENVQKSMKTYYKQR